MEKKLIVLLGSKQLQTICIAVWTIVVCLPIVYSLFKSGVDCDSAYYILIAERMTEGCTLYKGIVCGYTPLWICIEALFKVVFHIPNGLYWPYLLLFYCFELGSAYFLYRLLLKLEIPQMLSYFGATLFLLIVHWLDGNCLLLEIPFVFWGLLSCWLIFEWVGKSAWLYMLIGVLGAFAFLSKQYGAGYFVLNIMLIIYATCRQLDGKRSMYVCMYVIGYLLPIIVCIFTWGNDFMQSTLFNGYGTQAALDAGYDISLGTKIDKILGGLWFFLKFTCPVAIVLLLFFPAAYQQKRLFYIIFACSGILGFAFSFYFNFGGHYVIPLIPFGIILTTEILQLRTGKILSVVKYITVVLMIIISLYKTYNNRVYKLYYKRDIRNKQIELANCVKQYIADDETIFIIHGGIFYLYFIADILPPNLSTIGYSFGPMGLNEKTCGEQIRSADYVLRYSADYPYESEFTADLKHELERYPVEVQLSDSAILLHKMK